MGRGKLTPEQYEALSSRLLTYKYKTHAELGREFGVTRENVRQINEKLGLMSRKLVIKERNDFKKLSIRTKKENCMQRLKEAYPAEWAAYSNAKQRCNNAKNSMYKNYGGRGIVFLFNNFREFWEHIGPRPEGLSLDRINNNGNYEFGNVMWSTQKEQCRPGKRRRRII
jgi:hypothetical protein